MLTDEDKKWMKSHQTPPEEQKQDRGVLDGITWKVVKRRLRAEFKCPLCKRLSTGKDKCGKCGAIRLQFGNIDLCYYNKKGGKATSAQEDEMKRLAAEKMNG